MNVVRKNTSNYFPQGIVSVWAVPVTEFFQPLHSSNMYVVAQDLPDRSIIAVNVEDPADTITLPKHHPVKHFKIF
jgi:hypothetical protein